MNQQGLAAKDLQPTIGGPNLNATLGISAECLIREVA